jgi:hypothetical protein
MLDGPVSEHGMGEGQSTGGGLTDGPRLSLNADAAGPRECNQHSGLSGGAAVGSGVGDGGGVIRTAEMGAEHRVVETLFPIVTGKTAERMQN